MDDTDNLTSAVIPQGRCSICPARNRCVEGDGPKGAIAFCIGEAPGYEEDKGGVVFSGAAGLEYNVTYLPLAGLHRSIHGGVSEVYTTNTVKCRPAQNKKPTDKEAWGCGQHFLPYELKEIEPDVVVLMGATACKVVEMNGGKRIDLEAEHGIPRRGRLWEWEGWIVPLNHPASGLHDSKMMIPMLEDWERLEPWLRKGEWGWREDVLPHRDYRLARTKLDVRNYFLDYKSVANFYRLIGGDTESHDGVWWSSQVSIHTGTGLMVLAENMDVMEVLGECIAPYEIALHNAPADLDIFTQMIGRAPQYRDTMQEAYGFGNLGQKLKVLSRRLLGRIRPGWEELVTPPSKEKLWEWMMTGFAYSEKNWQVVEPRFAKRTGKPLKPRVHSSLSEKLLRELLNYSMNNSEYPVWEKLSERLPEESIANLIEAIGPIPQLGIANCKLEDAVYYGCSDADDTLALAIMFKKMREEFVEKMNWQEEDADA